MRIDLFRAIAFLLPSSINCNPKLEPPFKAQGIVWIFIFCLVSLQLSCNVLILSKIVDPQLRQHKWARRWLPCLLATCVSSLMDYTLSRQNTIQNLTQKSRKYYEKRQRYLESMAIDPCWPPVFRLLWIPHFHVKILFEIWQNTPKEINQIWFENTFISWMYDNMLATRSCVLPLMDFILSHQILFESWQRNRKDKHILKYVKLLLKKATKSYKTSRNILKKWQWVIYSCSWTTLTFSRLLRKSLEDKQVGYILQNVT